jgi:hypothetical protein
VKSNPRGASATAVIGFMIVAFVVFLVTKSIPAALVVGGVVAVALTRSRSS